MPENIFERAERERRVQGEQAVTGVVGSPPQATPKASMSQSDFGGKRIETPEEKSRKARKLAALLRARQ